MSDLWAVGNAGASTLGLHWSGSSSSVVPTPNGPSYWNVLTGVAAVSSTDVWAVGYSYNEIDICCRGRSDRPGLGGWRGRRSDPYRTEPCPIDTVRTEQIARLSDVNGARW